MVPVLEKMNGVVVLRLLLRVTGVAPAAVEAYHSSWPVPSAAVVIAYLRSRRIMAGSPRLTSVTLPVVWSAIDWGKVRVYTPLGLSLTEMIGEP